MYFLWACLIPLLVPHLLLQQGNSKMDLIRNILSPFPYGIIKSPQDMSPNYAGTILGISNTIASSAGFVSPIVTGYITEGQV